MSKSRPRIALVSGHWGQNIGNAFFNIGGKHILEQAFPDAHVEFIQDQPGYRTFHKQRTGNPRNDVNLLKHLSTDYIVLQGPMLTTSFRALWQDTFRELKKRGTKVIFLSAALFRYTDEEIEQNRRFLEEIQPVIFSTRDQPTFDAFKDCCPNVYAGIDSAFFAADAYTPFDLVLSPYITINYDRFPEPDIQVGKTATAIGPCDQTFEALSLHWGLCYPRLHEKMAHRGKISSYLGAMGDFRKLPSNIAGFTVVRPEHRVNPHIGWKIYKNPNAVASDEPWTYFTVYAGTSLTLSDRVHACVATLAYGKPAMLYRHTKRAHLFDRVGAHDIGTRPVTLDVQKLRQEKQALVEFLRAAWPRIQG